MRTSTLAAAAIMGTLTGCNALLGLDEPQPAIDPSTPPSCETGWTQRIDVTVRNETSAPLVDFQIPLHVDGAALLAAGAIAPDAADLRIVDADGDLLARELDGPLDAPDVIVWARARLLSPGTTALSVFIGNPSASSLPQEDVFERALGNPSFEQVGGWTIDPSDGSGASYRLPSPYWASDGTSSLFVDQEVNGQRTATSRSSISQTMSLPTGTSYVLRFDLNVIAASNGGVDGVDNGEFGFDVGNGLGLLYALNGNRGSITGVHRGEESVPFSGGEVPLEFVTRVAPGDEPGYAKGYLDHVRVRKHVDPEPEVTSSLVEPCD